MTDDQFRLSEFKKALRQHVNEGIVDLDEAYLHKFNFQIHRYEDVLRNSRMSSPPNRWSYYRIGLIKQGEGELITGIYRFKAVKNTLVIIPSRVITSSKDWTFDTQGYILLFNNDFLLQNNVSHQLITTKKILSSSFPPYIQLTDDQAEEFTRIFEMLLSEKKGAGVAGNELIAIKIIELVLLSERLYEEKNGAVSGLPYSDIMKQFIDLLDIHFMKEHSVGFYAQRLAIHPNQLNALIKKHSGLSAKESIQNRLMLEIKYLLHSTELSIKEISNQMGFSGQNYLTTFFKRSENLSPVKYRSVFG
jgi:AraC family transcriptional regulator, transcriptional activator of pobA